MSSRDERRRIAEQSIQIMEEGEYVAEDGTKYDISDEIRLAVANTEHIPPSTTFNINRQLNEGHEDEEEGEEDEEEGEVETRKKKPSKKKARETVIEITDESTLQCAFRLFESKKYEKIAILNFASAKNPGGGFLKGSQAQEESIARSSALYVCVKDSKYYAENRKTRDGLYTNWMMYTPSMPIFRNSMTNELIKPFQVNVITCPACNAGVFLKRGGSKQELERKMKERMDRIIRLAIMHENEAIVLGAYGCGVFRNRIDFVSQHFKFLVEDRYKNYFKNVTYAILGKSFRVFGDCYKSGTKAYVPSSKKKRKKNAPQSSGKKGRGKGQQRRRKDNQKKKSIERKKRRNKKYEVFK